MLYMAIGLYKVEFLEKDEEGKEDKDVEVKLANTG